MFFSIFFVIFDTDSVVYEETHFEDYYDDLFDRSAVSKIYKLSTKNTGVYVC